MILVTKSSEKKPLTRTFIDTTPYGFKFYRLALSARTLQSFISETSEFDILKSFNRSQMPELLLNAVLECPE